MDINHKNRTILLKVVYYGPALCGKTTNLRETFARLKPEQKLTDSIIEIPTESDRTLKYEFASLQIGKLGNYTTQFSVYTVPGQVYYEASRRLILDRVDGVVFVADSQRGKGDENILSLTELETHLLKINKRLYEDVALVLQFNKQDMDNAMPPELMAHTLQKNDDTPFFPASASDGVGVMETFQTILMMTAANVRMGRNAFKT